jgi:hypothetical protein
MYIWRPNRALDFKDPDVIFGSQRLKQKLVIPQDVDVSFNRDQGIILMGVRLYII